MKLSELIQNLESIRSSSGDLDAFIITADLGYGDNSVHPLDHIETKDGVVQIGSTSFMCPYVTQAPYNADNTGATDAHDAITDAIADAIAAGSSNKGIYLPAGTYKLLSGITLPSRRSLNPMNLYLITRTNQHNYDEYDSAVVAAPSAEAATKIHPLAGIVWKDQQWQYVRPHGSFAPVTFDCWVHPDQVEVKFLGHADEGIKEGPILGSFNAG